MLAGPECKREVAKQLRKKLNGCIYLKFGRQRVVDRGRQHRNECQSGPLFDLRLGCPLGPRRNGLLQDHIVSFQCNSLVARQI